MTVVIAIDPGSEYSAYVAMYAGHIQEHGRIPNDHLNLWLAGKECCAVSVVCEMIACYGMSVGAEVFDTAVWIGEFRRTCKDRDIPWSVLTRIEVKKRLCHHTAGVNDAVIRQRLIDVYGGKEKAIGKKANPGPLYGIKADVWSALAVAKAWEVGQS